MPAALSAGSKPARDEFAERDAGPLDIDVGESGEADQEDCCSEREQPVACR